jgi:hypothetical protein
MKQFFSAIICLTIFSGIGHSQKLAPVVSIKNQIKTYPLEAMEYLYLQLPFQLMKQEVVAELYNENGKLLISEKVTGPIMVMYTGALLPGNYQLKITWNSGITILPVIKRHYR